MGILCPDGHILPQKYQKTIPQVTFIIASIKPYELTNIFFSYMPFVLFACVFNNILKDNNLKPRLSYYSWHLHFETWPSSSYFPKPTFTPTVHFDEWYHPASQDHALFLILSLSTAKYCWPGLFFTGIYVTQTDIIKGNNSTDLPDNFYWSLTSALLDLDKNPLFLLES